MIFIIIGVCLLNISTAYQVYKLQRIVNDSHFHCVKCGKNMKRPYVWYDKNEEFKSVCSDCSNMKDFF